MLRVVRVGMSLEASTYESSRGADFYLVGLGACLTHRHLG